MTIFKVSAAPVMATLKLACWNAIMDYEDEQLPFDKEIFLIDTSKKKSMAKIRNDTELGRTTSIGVLMKVK